MEIKIIEHYSPNYWKLVTLRDKILREPLNLMFSEEELYLENKQIHIGAFENEKAIGCLILKEIDDKTLKMRQVCVTPEQQNTGVGQKLVKFSENYAQEKNITKLVCNARETAIPFYESLGYSKKGEPFYEVKILHYLMEKEMK